MLQSCHGFAYDQENPIRNDNDSQFSSFFLVKVALCIWDITLFEKFNKIKFVRTGKYNESLRNGEKNFLPLGLIKKTTTRSSNCQNICLRVRDN